MDVAANKGYGGLCEDVSGRKWMLFQACALIGDSNFKVVCAR